MSTVVTPIADQVSTVANWAAMVAAIDRGYPDPLSQFADTHDSERLQYAGISGSSNVPDTNFVNVMTLNVDLGQTFFYDGSITIYNTVGSSPYAPDDLGLRITASSGVKAVGLLFTSSWDAPVTNPSIPFALSGSNSSFAVMSTGSGSIVTTTPFFLSFVGIGDTASGTITLELAKVTDLRADEWAASYSFLLGARILG
tara:strand:- start:41 stop:637 length:597 start_codon:yes stop_codon:yes gene_type:complete